MTTITVHTLNAFALRIPGGNPAGIVFEAEGLSEAQMQETARQVGFSETAFFLPATNADFRLRYFTPNEEVDLCGHATVAAFVLMVAQQRIKPGRFTIHTGAGLLEIELRSNGEAFLTQTLPVFGKSLNRQPIVEALGLSIDDLDERLPIQIVSTGLPDIMVPVRSEAGLADIQPDLDAIAAISRMHGAVGIHAFTTDTRSGATASCRNFAPLYDIPEESATGTSNGALACYLHQYERLNASAEGLYACVFEQGESMGLPSRIYAELRLDGIGNIGSIRVGGSASGIDSRVVSL